MEIRRIRAQDDFFAIGNIYAQSWKAAYKGIVPQEYLDSLTGEQWSGLPGRQDFEGYALMDGEKYVGVASVHDAREESMAGWGEIVSIYLLPEYFGQGHGKLLMDRAIRALEERGLSRIYIRVLEENRQARRFYEKNGFFLADDAVSIHIAGKELVMVRYDRERRD